MTYLPAEVAGRWFYLYLILDVYNRKIVGFEVHDRDDADHAAHLVKRTALAEGRAMAAKPVLHGDNGVTLKATTVPSMSLRRASARHYIGTVPTAHRPCRRISSPVSLELTQVSCNQGLRPRANRQYWEWAADPQRPRARPGHDPGDAKEHRSACLPMKKDAWRPSQSGWRCPRDFPLRTRKPHWIWQAG
jgi:hypothetical protein